MKTYIIEYIDYCYSLIEAENEEEALEKWENGDEECEDYGASDTEIQNIRILE